MLKLKIGAKVMLTITIDIQDRLINGQKFAQDSVSTCNILIIIVICNM